MLPTEQLDMLNYTRAFKGNYRKGPHTLRAILSSPAQGRGFASNLGGVSVVFGVPLGQPDKNSDELYSILTGSKWCDQAVETWLHGFHEFDTLDQLLSDVTVCRELANDPFIFRAVGASSVAAGKTIARLAGLDPSSYANMTAIASSSTAMAAVASSSTARAAVAASPAAMAAVCASSMAVAKYAAGAAGLDPASFADMTALASSSTAMAAVAASSTAMTAVVASSTAMAAVITSATARNAISASATAKTALRNSPLKVTKSLTTNNWVTTTTGRGWLIDYYQPTNPGGNVGWTIDGTLKAIQTTGTTKVEMWAVNSSSIYWHYSGSWATYIPC